MLDKHLFSGEIFQPIGPETTHLSITQSVIKHLTHSYAHGTQMTQFLLLRSSGLGGG